MMAGSKEDAETVGAFFQNMHHRGLGDPLLVISGGAPGARKCTRRPMQPQWQQCGNGQSRYGGITDTDGLRGNLQAHCMPQSMEETEVDDYDGFMKERRLLTTGNIRDHYGSLWSGSAGLLHGPDAPAIPCPAPERLGSGHSRNPCGSVIRPEQTVEGLFRLPQPRFAENYRLRLAHRIGDQALLVQSVHRIPIERFPRPCAHCRGTVMDAEVEQGQYGFIDFVLLHGGGNSHCRLRYRVDNAPGSAQGTA